MIDHYCKSCCVSQTFYSIPSIIPDHELGYQCVACSVCHTQSLMCNTCDKLYIYNNYDCRNIKSHILQNHSVLSPVESEQHSELNADNDNTFDEAYEDIDPFPLDAEEEHESFLDIDYNESNILLADSYSESNLTLDDHVAEILPPPIDGPNSECDH